MQRDDGLAVFKNVRSPASEKMKKQLQTLFKQKGLQITVKCNLKIVNDLDVTFNLNNDSYRSYRKPNNKTYYIHFQSDHPSSINKQLPRSIGNNLSKLSSSQGVTALTNMIGFTFHCVKSVRIQSYSGPYSPTFGLNTDQNNSKYEHFSHSGSVRPI